MPRGARLQTALAKFGREKFGREKFARGNRWVRAKNDRQRKMAANEKMAPNETPDRENCG
jgi:hypothetical protein